MGDGAGVGKGRQIAALALEHYKTGGRRTLWISVSNDLRFDAKRDLQDVEAEDLIKVWPTVSIAPWLTGECAHLSVILYLLSLGPKNTWELQISEIDIICQPNTRCQ